MKQSQLRQLIREEIGKVINEETLSQSITGYGKEVKTALEALEKYLLDKKLNINELTDLISDIVMASHERGMEDSQKDN